MAGMVGFPYYSIEIKQTFAQIGIESKMAELQIQQSPSPGERSLNPPEWRVLPRQAELEINNDAFRSEFDIESPVAWTTKLSGEYAAAADEGTRWIAQNGDLCYRATPGDMRPLLDFAMRYFAAQDAKEINVGLSPQSAPQIIPHVDPAVRFEVSPPSREEIRYQFSSTPASLHVYLEVKPDLQIKAIPSLDMRL